MEAGERSASSAAGAGTGKWPTGCRFAARCEFAFDRCREAPPMFERDGTGGGLWLQAEDP